ncbi:MAG: glutaredoxin family protein [Planctomycetes bacterium]|nr:glutaredoxin family protein [Planctomycetota bacterium]
MTSEPRLLTVFARDWCTLCDDMIAALAPWRREHGIELDIVFIDDDPELETRYGTLVPVLTEGDVEICHHFLDAEALRTHLARSP